MVFGSAARGGRSLLLPHRWADSSNSITAKIHLVAGYKAFIIPKVSSCRNNFFFSLKTCLALERVEAK